jgi:hypothetical protein
MPKERPELKGLVNDQTTVIENFQNTVIRPIIKMQNDLLFALLYQNFIKRKVVFSLLSTEKKKEKIRSILEKDIQFKNQIIGVILGHFSMEEYNNYKTQPSEFNRRIKQIIIKRFQDSIS